MACHVCEMSEPRAFEGALTSDRADKKHQGLLLHQKYMLNRHGLTKAISVSNLADLSVKLVKEDAGVSKAVSQF